MCPCALFDQFLCQDHCSCKNSVSSQGCLMCGSGLFHFNWNSMVFIKLNQCEIAPWELVKKAQTTISNSDAKRIVEGGAFFLNGKQIIDANKPIHVKNGDIFIAGRHRDGQFKREKMFAKIEIESVS